MTAFHSSLHDSGEKISEWKNFSNNICWLKDKAF